MPIGYRLTALPRPMRVGGRDVDRQRNAALFGRDLDLDAAGLLAAPEGGAPMPPVRWLLTTAADMASRSQDATSFSA
jgi:hypothetical protein